MTPAQLLTAAERAVNAATSVRIVGTVGTGGQAVGLDLDLVANQGGRGTIRQGGYTTQIVRLGGKAYFDAGSAFWTHIAGTAGAQLFAGRWIEASATSGPLASFTSLTSMRTLIGGLLGSHGPLVLGGSATVGGRAVLVIRDTGNGATLEVAAAGAPLPLEATSKAAGSLRFESWNQPFALVAPPRPIDYSSLVKPQSTTPARPSGQAQQIPGEGLTIVLPSGWSTQAPPKSLGGGLIRFLALAPAQDGFRANLNVIVEPRPPGQSLRQVIFSGASAAFQYAGTVRSVTVDGVSGLEYRSTKAVKTGTRPLLTEAWAFVHGDEIYQFTFTALASSAGQFDPLFTTSARTIRFTAGAGADHRVAVQAQPALTGNAAAKRRCPGPPGTM